jgi:hypothetical protein
MNITNNVNRHTGGYGCRMWMKKDYTEENDKDEKISGG